MQLAGTPCISTSSFSSFCLLVSNPTRLNSSSSSNKLVFALPRSYLSCAPSFSSYLSLSLSLSHSILHFFSLFFTETDRDGNDDGKGSNGNGSKAAVKAKFDQIRRGSVALVKATKAAPQPPPPPPPILTKQQRDKGGVPMPPPIRQKGVPSTISVLPMAMLPALLPTAAGSRAAAAEERAERAGGGAGAGSPSGTSSASDGTANVLGVWTLGLGLLGDSE